VFVGSYIKSIIAAAEFNIGIEFCFNTAYIIWIYLEVEVDSIVYKPNKIDLNQALGL
jgi:hypothetical protein